MKALLCEKHGPPEDLVCREVEMPIPGPGEVLVRTGFASVNFPDRLIIENKYQTKPTLPFSPGCELAGVVEAHGPGVHAFNIGSRVSALTGYGAFAEYVLVPAERLNPVPPGVPLDVAAAFEMTYGTSYHALKQRARLQPGESIAILGAAGGVGLAAVELASVMGARVIACASSTEKLELARRHGAVETIDYSVEDLKGALNALTRGEGVDVVYDPVGDRFAEPAFRAMKWEGRYLVIGFAGGEIPSIPLNLPLLKGASLVGVFLGQFIERTPELHRENMRELMAWLDEGRLKPAVTQRFSLEYGGDAIRTMAERGALGKIVIEINPKL